MRDELLLAFVMLIVLLIWARAASMVNVFFPVGEALALLGWLQFLAVGSAVGAVFAAFVFSASVYRELVVVLPLIGHACRKTVASLVKN